MSTTVAEPVADLLGTSPRFHLPTGWVLTPEDVPSLENLMTDDETPVDNRFVEKLLRLLVECLYSSWTPPEGQPFQVMSDVGLFYVAQNPPIVPDLMLALGIATPADFRRKENRSYFVWIVGKVPDLVLEVVSDTRGGEDSTKMADYARMGIKYYVIYDPEDHLSGGELRAFNLNTGSYQACDASWIPALGLGLTFWTGDYEGHTTRWLRWCDQTGRVIATGKERAEAEHQRAEAEHQRAERLAQQLKALGVDPSR